MIDRFDKKKKFLLKNLGLIIQECSVFFTTYLFDIECVLFNLGNIRPVKKNKIMQYQNVNIWKNCPAFYQR